MGKHIVKSGWRKHGVGDYEPTITLYKKVESNNLDHVCQWGLSGSHPTMFDARFEADRIADIINKIIEVSRND